MTIFDPFYASVSHKAIDKATRLFNATPGDIFNELIQNARRAGAARIDVGTADGDAGAMVVFRDDGCGIADPKSLLTLGGSGWEAGTLSREDPAGMGFFSLSQRACAISSRTPDAGIGWNLRLTPEQFCGRAPVMAEPFPMKPGTEIMFVCDDACSAATALEAAARYCPVPVYLNGEQVDRKDFLADAHHMELWNGIRIGVFHCCYGHNEPRINFHGLTLPAALPTVSAAMSRSIWCVRLDVLDCPGLKLVLPARKEVVQDGFFEDVKAAARRAIYRAVALEPRHGLSHGDWQKARALGVDLPEAAAELRLWRPTTADINCGYAEPVEAVPKDACLVTAGLEPPEAQCFYRAFGRRRSAITLYEPCPAFSGYGWYDDLPKITGLRYVVSEDGERRGIEPTDCDTTRDDNVRDDNARARVAHIGIWVETEHPDGAVRESCLDADLLFLGNPHEIALYEVGFFVTEDSDLDVHQLADLLHAACFCPSDDVDADSYDTQAERFDDEACHIASAFLLSPEEATMESLKAAINRDLLWLLPRDGKTVITVTGRDIHIERIPAEVSAAASEDT